MRSIYNQVYMYIYKIIMNGICINIFILFLCSPLDRRQLLRRVEKCDARRSRWRVGTLCRNSMRVQDKYLGQIINNLLCIVGTL